MDQGHGLIWGFINFSKFQNKLANSQEKILNKSNAFNTVYQSNPFKAYYTSIWYT